MNLLSTRKLSLFGMGLLGLTISSLSPGAHGGAFTGGDIAVYRVGDGVSGLVNTGAQVFIDEYSPTGTLVQSIAVPANTTTGLVASGTASSEGLLSRSADGLALLFTGYSSAIPAASSLSGTTSASVNRVVAILNQAGTLDASTRLSDFASGNNPRSVASTNGTDIWVAGGAGGILYTTKGSATSTVLNSTQGNNRQVGIFNNQLYVSAAAGTGVVRLSTVGTGTPTTTGQTITGLPGISATASFNAFFFADIDTGVSGLDTLFVADEAAGLSKFSFDGTIWTARGVVGVSADAYRGLTGTVSGSSVTLFATRKGGSGLTGGGELVTLTDASGSTGNLTGTPTLLATAATNTAFRGIALTPVPEPTSLGLAAAGMLIVMGRRRRSAKA